jgi:hypothetical protein
MIPTWQIVGLIILSLIGLALGVYSAPNSFAYLSLTGQCAQEPVPVACRTRFSGTR